MSTEKKRFVFAERNKALQMAAMCGLSVIEQKAELRGYQIYIVEQWVCDRKAPSNVVKIFTGVQEHVIQVAVIAISTAELQHPRPQIKAFLNLGAHLKSKPTHLGEILLTNPSELGDMNMIVIPDGDYDKYINRIYVNINLRRTNCTGRSSLNIQDPNPASEEKFRSLYKIADTVNFEETVIKLVSLVQIALYLFKLLDKDSIDGLICDETNHAFWTFYELYQPAKTTDFTLKEPWMEPHLLAAIISKLIVCRNKLQDLGFTTIKDPFSEYDNFRFDIGDYQRSKNLKLTKFIDLETLAKLNDSNFSQMKVRKVIKSKLDDISGVTNSPLFSETSDPEMFRYHATIDSVRAIWRPKLRGNLLYLTSSQGSGSGDTNDSKHTSKKSSRPNKIDILNRVAGSFPWVNTNDSSKSSNKSPHIISNTPSLIATPPTDLNRWNSHEQETSNTTHYNSYPLEEDLSKLSRKPSPLSSSFSSHISTPNPDPSLDDPLIPYPSIKHGLSLELIDQDIPSSVQLMQHRELRTSKSSETQGGFVPLSSRIEHKSHKRSQSDSIVFDSVKASFEKKENRPERPSHQRSNSVPDLNQDGSNLDRPVACMNVQTYLTYERLYQQQRVLQKTYQDIKALATAYERTAQQLKSTYEERVIEFNRIQKTSRMVMEDQTDTERRLKEVEDHSAKLHYELKVLNDKLKDIEDNVGTFYGKVGVLERRMDDSQHSITTMLMIGSYFNHYWIKVSKWVTSWLDNKETEI